MTKLRSKKREPMATTRKTRMVKTTLTKWIKWDLFPQDGYKLQISFPSYNQIHVVQTLSFKMVYYMPRVAAWFGVQNPLFPSEIPLFSINFWNVQWAISPLVLWRLVAHFVRTGLKCETDICHIYVPTNGVSWCNRTTSSLWWQLYNLMMYVPSDRSKPDNIFFRVPVWTLI